MVLDNGRTVLSASFQNLENFVSVDKYTAPRCSTFHTRDRYSSENNMSSLTSRTGSPSFNDSETALYGA